MTKRERLIILAFVISLPLSLFAATKILISQIKGDTTSTTGSIAVTTPNTSTSAWSKVGSNCSITSGVFNCSGGAGAAPTWAAEVPGGTINGTNTVFTLVNTPIINSQFLFWNGLALFPGAGDYTISGSTLTLTIAPQVDDTLIAVYQH
jgi:hypothetical protein